VDTLHVPVQLFLACLQKVYIFLLFLPDLLFCLLLLLLRPLMDFTLGNRLEKLAFEFVELLCQQFIDRITEIEQHCWNLRQNLNESAFW
jgi:hypothetical protein